MNTFHELNYLCRSNCEWTRFSEGEMLLVPQKSKRAVKQQSETLSYVQRQLRPWTRQPRSSRWQKWVTERISRIACVPMENRISTLHVQGRRVLHTATWLHAQCGTPKHSCARVRETHEGGFIQISALHRHTGQCSASKSGCAQDVHTTRLINGKAMCRNITGRVLPVKLSHHG